LSPPLAVRFWAAKSRILQSTTKLLLASFHDREAVVTSLLIGFTVAASPFSVCPARYLLNAAFTAVLPLPKRS
jgi:hypothetical protein